MYDMNLMVGEELILIDNDARSMDKRYIEVVAVVTNERLLILKDMNKDVDANDVMKTWTVQFMPNFEIMYEIYLDDIKEVTEGKILLENGKSLDLISEDVYHYFNNGGENLLDE